MNRYDYSHEPFITGAHPVFGDEAKPFKCLLCGDHHPTKFGLFVADKPFAVSKSGINVDTAQYCLCEACFTLPKRDELVRAAIQAGTEEELEKQEPLTITDVQRNELGISGRVAFTEPPKPYLNALHKIMPALAKQVYDRERSERVLAVRNYRQAHRELNDRLNALRNLDAKIDGAQNLIKEIERAKQSSGKAPWIETIDQQMQALKSLEALRADGRANNALTQDTKPGTLGWNAEIESMRMAEPYSFSGIALEAIHRASACLPMDSQINADSVIGKTGHVWWWFTPPIDLITSKYYREVAGVLVNVTHMVTREEIRDIASRFKGVDVNQPIDIEVQESRLEVNFSTYVRGKSYTLQPSLGWSWKFGQSLEDLRRALQRQYRRTYGAFGPYSDNQDKLDEYDTIESVIRFCKFYLAAGVWMRQEIIVPHREPIEHKQGQWYQRKHNLEHPPTGVKVIALRKRHQEETAAADSGGTGDKKKVDWQWQWGVEGHWRNQPYGPDRSMRKTIYIQPFMKGPDDKPLKPKQKKVIAVLR